MSRKRRIKNIKAQMDNAVLLEFIKCFYVLLNTVGGKMTVQLSVLKNLPPDWKERIQIENLEQGTPLGAYRISILKDEKAVEIIRPDTSLVFPN